MKLLLWNSGSNITDETLTNIGKALELAISLESLNLDFTNSKITSEGFKNLSNGIRRLSSIKLINLNFDMLGNFKSSF